SQAFFDLYERLVPFGGVYAVGFCLVAINSSVIFSDRMRRGGWGFQRVVFIFPGLLVAGSVWLGSVVIWGKHEPEKSAVESYVIGVQPNVPMAGLNEERWRELRSRQLDLASKRIAEVNTPPAKWIKPDQPVPVDPPRFEPPPTLVVLPESPM